MLNIPAIPADLHEKLEPLGDSLDNLKRLAVRIQGPHGIIPFVGAGLSAPYGYPMWRPFLIREAKKANVEAETQKLLNSSLFEEAAQLVWDHRGDAHFLQALADTFGPDTLPLSLPDTPVSILPCLGDGAVLTTNYDYVLQRVYEKAGSPFEPVVWGGRCTAVSNASVAGLRFLVKLHGDALDSELVLTSNQYEAVYGDLQAPGFSFTHPLPTLLHRLFVDDHSPLLFLGCSLDNDRTMTVLEKTAKAFKSIGHYAVIEAPEDNDDTARSSLFTKQKQLSDRGIFPIWYPHGEHGLLRPILNYLVTACEWKIGAKTFKLLPGIPQRVPNFTGLDKELAALRAAFEVGTPEARRQVVLGMDGIGKTSFAVEYCYRYAGAYSHVLWTRASSAADLDIGLVKFAQTLGLDERDDPDTRKIAKAVLEYLSTREDYLLVLDDVEDHVGLWSALEPSFPRGDVLITSSIRDHVVFRVNQPVAFHGLSPNEALALLLHKSARAENDDNRRDGAALVKGLGGLPLSIKLAGDYLYANHDVAIADYTIAGVDPGLTAAWEKNITEVRKQNPFAEGLLRISIFVDLDDIPVDLGKQYLQSATAVESALSLLHRYSLIDRNSTTATYSLHRLIRAAVQNKLKTDTASAYLMQTVESLAMLFPAPNPRNWADCERLLPHVTACAENARLYAVRSAVAAKLLFNLSTYLSQRARYATGEPFFSFTLEQLGVDHPNAATVARYLADSERYRDMAAKAISGNILIHADQLNRQGAKYYNQGNYRAAEPLWQHVLSIWETVLGPEHAFTLSILNNLAALYRARGDYIAAETLYRRAVAIHEKVDGPEQLDMVPVLGNLAELYHELGDYAAAEPLYKRALAISEELYGCDHLETAVSINNLAVLYKAQGNFVAAEPLYKRALAIKERALGLDHPSTATSLINLAGLYYSQGSFVIAERLYERALAINEKVQGLEHPDTARSLEGLAMLYTTQCNFSGAEPLYIRSIAIYETAFGPEHSRTAQSLNSLAVLYHGQCNYTAAEPLYKRALDIRETALGLEHPETAQSLQCLAQCYVDAGHSGAEPLLKRALAIQEKVLGRDHPDLARSLNYLGSLYFRQGNCAAALPLLKRALAIRNQVLGPQHPDSVECLGNNELVLRAMGKNAEADKLLRKRGRDGDGGGQGGA